MPASHVSSELHAKATNITRIASQTRCTESSGRVEGTKRRPCDFDQHVKPSHRSWPETLYKIQTVDPHMCRTRQACRLYD